MSASLSSAGDIVDLRRPPGGTPGTEVLVSTPSLRVLRMALSAGKEMATHRAPGELTIVCLEGTATLTVGTRPHKLSAGQFSYLAGSQPHSLRAEEDCVLLLSVVLPPRPPADAVDEASEESFPASDPPAHSPVTRP